MDENKRITMRDAPIKKIDFPKLSKPMTTHDLFKPKADIPKDPKAPEGPMITTANVEKIREQAAMRTRMEKARAAKMDKIKEELETREKAEEKKEKVKSKPKPAPKAKTEEKAKPEEKKAPESPPEAKPEVPEASDTPDKEGKPDPLKEAVDKANKQTSTRKSYTTKKKEEKDAD